MLSPEQSKIEPEPQESATYEEAASKLRELEPIAKEADLIVPKAPERGDLKMAEARKPEEIRVFQGDFMKSFSEFTDLLKLGDSEKAKIIYEHLNATYQELNGRNFGADIRTEAKKEAEKEGNKVIKKSEYFSPENLQKIKDKEHRKMRASSIQRAWDKLAAKPEGGIGQFAKNLEAQRQSLNQKGFKFSRDVFCAFLDDGYDFSSIKKGGLFGGKIKIKRGGEVKAFKLSEFEEKKQLSQNSFDAILEKVTEAKVSQEYTEARNRWMGRKLKTAGNIVSEVTKDYQPEVIAPNIETAPAEIKTETRTEDLKQDKEKKPKPEKKYGKRRRNAKPKKNGKKHSRILA